MPEAGKNFSVYFNQELLEKFECVQAHLGKGVSQALAHLVEAKYIEIMDGETRRDQIRALREEVGEYHSLELGYLKAIWEQMKNDTDHA